jgi:hypothetical protein
MNTRNRLAIATALAIALPSLAMAQSQAYTPDPNAAPPPSAAAAGTNTAAMPTPADQLPPGQASALAAGDNKLLTNGPVPDTPANRHRFGGPMSRAGKRTAPAGN